MVSVQDYPRPPINFTPTSPPLKKMKDKTKIDVRYSVVAPFAFIHIYWDPSIYEVRYEIEEPVLDDAEKKVRQQIISALMEMVNFDTVIDKELGLQNIHIITAVVKNYHARRALMTLRKHAPQNIQLKSAAYATAHYPFTKENWYNTENGNKKVMEEVEKIKIYLAKGELAEL